MKLTALVLAVLTVLASGVLPVCGGMCCPLAKDEAAVHAEMPCCSEPTFSPRDATALQPATFAAPHAPVAVIVVRAETSVAVPPHAHVTLTSEANHHPAPPLFLRNAQLLI